MGKHSTEHIDGILQEQIKYNVLELLKNEKYETKPNMAKFLKTYVTSIRICISCAKVDLWPKIHYDISKAIVRFKDDLTLIKDSNNNLYLCKEYDDIELNDKQSALILKFFNLLEQFRFIRNGNTDVKVFSTDIEKTNAELSALFACVKEKEIQLFRDYTPKISVS